MKKTILFGGTGLLGSIFLRDNPDIISVGRSNPGKGVNHIIIPDMDKLDPLDDIDIGNVIFLIGNSNHSLINKSSSIGVRDNVLPLKKVLHYLQNRSISKFVCFSTILLYGDKSKDRPVNENDEIFPYQNEYVFSKYLAEQVVGYYKDSVPIINIRLSNVYGDTSLIRPDLIPALAQDVLSSDKPSVWNMKPQRDFIFASDAVEAVMRLLETDFTGTVNIGAGTMHSVREVAKIFEDLSGKKIVSLEKKVSGVMRFVTDISLLQSLTGWKPKYSLREGIARTYHAMEKYEK